MSIQTILTIVYVLSTLILWALVVEARSQRDSRIAPSFGVLMLILSIWTGAYVLQLQSLSADAQWLWVRVRLTSEIFMPILWLSFVRAYTGAPPLCGLYRALWAVLPVLASIILWTNDLHGLYASRVTVVLLNSLTVITAELNSVGGLIAFGLLAIYILGAFYLVAATLRALRPYRQQLRVGLLAALLPLIGQAMESATDSPLRHMELVPLLAVVSGLLLVTQLVRREDQGTPIAFETVIASLPEAMVVLDKNMRVMAANRTFGLLFDLEPDQLVGQTLAVTLPQLAPALARARPDSHTHSDLDVFERIMQVSIGPMRDSSLLLQSRAAQRMAESESPNTLPLTGGALQGYVLICRDITQERAMQKALLSIERRYRALFDNNNDAILIVDMQGEIMLANQQTSDLLQVPLSRLFNERLSDFIVAEDIARMEDHRKRLLSGEMIPIKEYTLQLQHGEQVPVEVNLTLVREADGSPLHMQMVVRDIRERRQTEIALANERNLLRTLFDTIPDSLFVTDANGRYTLVNSAHLQNLGLDTAADFLGKYNQDFYPILLAERITEEDQLVMQTGVAHTQEELRNERWMSVSRVPLRAPLTDEPANGTVDPEQMQESDSADQVTGLVVLERDITESKRFQVDMQRSLEQVTILRQVDQEVTRSLHIDRVALIGLDAAVRLSLADAGYIALQNDEGLTVRHVMGDYSLTPGQQLDAERGLLSQVLTRREPQRIISLTDAPPVVGDLPEQQAVMMLPLMSNNRLLGVLELATRREDTFSAEVFQFIALLVNRIGIAIENASLYELTRRQLDEVQSLNETLRRLEQLKTDMIRVASHDLKNPLGIINGYLNMLEMDQELFDPLHLEYFEAIKRAVLRMDAILHDILSLERIEQRAVGGFMTRLSLKFLVEEAVKEFAQPMAEAQQKLDLQIGDVDTAMVYGDESQLYEAMSNLISNAVKYTPKNGEIRVCLRVDETHLIFEVEDNGYGIPDDRQERLFEPFYRAKAKGTEAIEGTGLGLHLVRNIVERHRGEIIFHSEFRQGSLFGFRLPLNPEAVPDPASVPPSPPREHTPSPEPPQFFD